jgi:hypothetical protein
MGCSEFDIAAVMSRPRRAQSLSRFLLVTGILVLTIVAVAQERTSQTVAADSQIAPENLVPNVVRIEAHMRDHTENGFGFIVGQRDQTLYVVTAYHVISDPQEVTEASQVKVKLEFADRRGESYDAKVIGTHDTAHDLGVLTVPAPSGFHWNKECQGVPEDQKRPTEVWFIGRDQNWYVSIVPGRVASTAPVDSRMDLEGLAIRPGSSGGPLVARSGIVGMIQNDSAEGTKALTIDFIKAAFQDWMHPWNLERHASSPTPLSRQENSLRDGNYQLHRWRGAPQKLGVIMTLRKVSEDLFLVETKIPDGSFWEGEFHRKEEYWDLVIGNHAASLDRYPDTSYNPASGRYQISREGPIIRLTSSTATWEWVEK